MPGVNPPANQWLANKLAQMDAEIKALKAQRTQYIIDASGEAQAIIGNLSKDPSGSDTGLSGFGIALWNGGAWENPALQPWGELAFNTITLTSGVDYDLGASALSAAYGKNGFTTAANGSGKKLVVPRTGLYRMAFIVRVDFSTAAWNYCEARARYNGSDVPTMGYAITSGYGTADTFHMLSFESFVNLSAGDTMSVAVQPTGQNVVVQGASSSIPGSLSLTYMGQSAVGI